MSDLKSSVTFRVRVRVKDRFSISVVFRVRVMLLISIQWRGMG